MSNIDELDTNDGGYQHGSRGQRKPRRRRTETEFEVFSAPIQAAEEHQAPMRPAAEPKQERLEPRPERRQQSERKAEGEASRWAIVRFFKNDGTRLFVGIALMIMCVFMGIAVLSHLKFGAYDQSYAQNLNPAQMGAVSSEVKNAAGPFGAWLSHVLMSDTFGLGSLAMIVYMWILAMSVMGFMKCNFWSLTFKTLLVTVAASVVLGLVTYNSATTFHWGGYHGRFANEFLMRHTTVLGAILVSILLVSAVACVYLAELKSAFNKWRDRANRIRLQEQLKREKKRELADLAAAKEAEHQEEPGADMPDEVKDEPEPAPDLKEEPEEEPKEEIEDRPDPGFRLVFGDNSDEEEPAEEPVEEEFSISAGLIAQADAIDKKPSEGVSGASTGLQEPYDHRADLSRYQFPPVDLLTKRDTKPVVDMEEQQANKTRIVETLANYGIPISKISATVGPTVTLYEIVPAEGVRISQIRRLEDDIALSLSALGIRIVAPIPGKGTVGIEVPNKEPQTVSMHSVITSKAYQEDRKAELPMAMGATISNDIFIADMAKMPHLLVAGATGMGKSVGLNAIITSLLYKKHPSELKFVMVDPKMVEFSLYSKIERHYLAKLPGEEDAIITDMAKVIQTLNSLCVEMDDRYNLLKNANVRGLVEYNEKFSNRRLNPSEGHRYLPYIVVVIDEFADLILTAGKEVENPIMRLAQKARAVGIHLILATQRPSTNVITGAIKANFPGRIAFRVIQMVDSRTILDSPGANQLIGRGDMLFSHNGIMKRVQCAFISTEEVEAITDWIDKQVGYEHAYYLPEVPAETGGEIAQASTDRDPMFDDAARFVVQRQIGSTSSLQRQFNIGYSRAGRLMDQMEAAGIVGPVNGAKPRNILVDSATLERMLGNEI